MLKQPTEYLDSLETMMALSLAAAFLTICSRLAGESLAALAFPPLDAAI